MNTVSGSALRAAVASRSLTIGPWVGIPDPTVVELMAGLDNDFLLMDGEHAALPPAALRSLLPCAEAYAKPVLYRVPSHAPTHLKHALDLGVSGVMVPMVETPDQAAAIVAACRYAPLGVRGIGPWRASGYYRHFSEYMANANDLTTLILQLESAAGLHHLDAIAAVPGYDVLYVGPTDLASALALPLGELGSDMLSILQRICVAGLAAGKTLGIDVADATSLPMLRELGFSFFTLGSDMGYVTEAGRAQATALATLNLRRTPS